MKAAECHNDSSAYNNKQKFKLKYRTLIFLIPINFGRSNFTK